MSESQTKTDPSVGEPDPFFVPVPHHISDQDTWGAPDRNYFVFVALSILLGFFGLDHVYLRSYGTAMKKFAVNIFGLGFWYLWDVIQVLKDGSHIRKEGLNSPLDWIRGIGRGTFVPLPVDLPPAERKAAATGPKFAAPKSYILYTFLAVCLGVFGADKFYMGEVWQGIVKICSVFNIFLFLFGLFWVAWDAFHAIFMTNTILKEGITAPMPFSFIFSGKISPESFKVKEVQPEEDVGSGGIFSGVLGFLPSAKSLYNELAVPLLRPTVGTAVSNITKATNIANKAVALGSTALTAGPAMISQTMTQMANQAVQAPLAAAMTAVAPPGIPTPPTVSSDVGFIQSLAANTAAARTPVSAAPPPAQSGGGGGGSGGGPGPIIAGSLTALILAGGIKGCYDLISKQYA